MRHIGHHDQHNVNDNDHCGPALHDNDDHDKHHDHDDNDRRSYDYYNHDDYYPAQGLAVLLLLRVTERKPRYHNYDRSTRAVYRKLYVYMGIGQPELVAHVFRLYR